MVIIIRSMCDLSRDMKTKKKTQQNLDFESTKVEKEFNRWN